MLADTLHREDIKAILRKRHGTMQAFADACGLKSQAIADFLRGRTSAHVADLVEAELRDAAQEDGFESMKLDGSNDDPVMHSINAGVR